MHDPTRQADTIDDEPEAGYESDRPEAGYVMPMTALILIPLMIFAALATDVGAWYIRADQAQRAADSAALAGTVWLPDETAAQNIVLDVAARNGFRDPAWGRPQRRHRECDRERPRPHRRRRSPRRHHHRVAVVLRVGGPRRRRHRAPGRRRCHPRRPDGQPQQRPRYRQPRQLRARHPAGRVSGSASTAGAKTTSRATRSRSASSAPRAPVARSPTPAPVRTSGRTPP